MRYFIFQGYNYYPNRGMDDWVATVDCLADVTQVLKENFHNNYDWFQVFDTEKRIVVERGNC